VVLGVVGLLVAIDPLAKAGVEKGGTTALGVETTVENLDLGLLDGTLTMNRLRVDNPKDYQADYLMQFERFDLALDSASVLTDTIKITKFEMDSLELNIEQKLGKSNISEVMEHLKKIGGEKKDQPAEEKKGKKLRVDRIVLRNVKATFSLLSGPPVPVEVDEIVLENLTDENAQGLVIEELIARIIPAILKNVLEKSKGLVPSDFLNDLNSQVADVTKALGEGAEKFLKQMDTGVKKLFEGDKKDGDSPGLLDNILKPKE
jgi:hypothetical protein